MNERLFSYAVILHPTESERKAGTRSKVVVSPSEYRLFRNEQEVMLVAMKEIPAEAMEYADRLEVAVRPF